MNSGQGMTGRVWGRAVSAAAMIVALGWAGAGVAQEAPPATQAQEGQDVADTPATPADAPAEDSSAAPMATGDAYATPPAPS